MNNNQRLANNVIFLYVRLIIVMLISLYAIRVVMHELGTEGFGIFNVVAGFISMFGFIGATITSGIQRFFSFEMGKRGESAAIEVYTAAVRIQVIISVIVTILLETIGLWYVNNIMNVPYSRIAEINYLYQFAIFSLILNILVVPYNAFVISKEHMNWYALVSIIENVCKLGIAFAIGYFNNNKLSIYGFLLLVVSIINFLCYYIYCKKLFPWLKIAKKATSNRLIHQILTFSGWNSVCAFANMGRGQGSNLLLNYFFGVVVNAANAIVTHIYSVVQLFAMNICIAFRPQLTEAYAKHDYNKAKEMMFVMSKTAYTMVFIICIPLFLELSFILNLWLGKDVPNLTIDFTGIILLVVLVGSLNTPVSMVIYANGNIKSYTILYSMMCLCLPLGWIAFKLGFDAISIFWITLILMILIHFFSLKILKKYINYSYPSYIREVLVPISLFTLLSPLLPLILKYINYKEEWLEFLFVTITSIIWSMMVGLLVIPTKRQRVFITSRLFKIKK